MRLWLTIAFIAALGISLSGQLRDSIIVTNVLPGKSLVGPQQVFIDNKLPDILTNENGFSYVSWLHSEVHRNIHIGQFKNSDDEILHTNITELNPDYKFEYTECTAAGTDFVNIALYSTPENQYAAVITIIDGETGNLLTEEVHHSFNTQPAYLDICYHNSVIYLFYSVENSYEFTCYDMNLIKLNDAKKICNISDIVLFSAKAKTSSANKIDILYTNEQKILFRSIFSPDSISQQIEINFGRNMFSQDFFDFCLDDDGHLYLLHMGILDGKQRLIFREFSAELTTELDTKVIYTVPDSLQIKVINPLVHINETMFSISVMSLTEERADFLMWNYSEQLNFLSHSSNEIFDYYLHESAGYSFSLCTDGILVHASNGIESCIYKFNNQLDFIQKTLTGYFDEKFFRPLLVSADVSEEGNILIHYKYADYWDRKDDHFLLILDENHNPIGKPRGIFDHSFHLNRQKVNCQFLNGERILITINDRSITKGWNLRGKIIDLNGNILKNLFPVMEYQFKVESLHTSEISDSLLILSWSSLNDEFKTFHCAQTLNTYTLKKGQNQVLSEPSWSQNHDSFLAGTEVGFTMHMRSVDDILNGSRLKWSPINNNGDVLLDEMNEFPQFSANSYCVLIGAHLDEDYKLTTLLLKDLNSIAVKWYKLDGMSEYNVQNLETFNKELHRDFFEERITKSDDIVLVNINTLLSNEAFRTRTYLVYENDPLTLRKMEFDDDKVVDRCISEFIGDQILSIYETQNSSDSLGNIKIRTDEYDLVITDIEDEVNIPLSFRIGAYPNPFNPETKIEFNIPEKGGVKLDIFNSLGQKVTTLADGIYFAGRHEVIFNGENISSGVYFAHLLYSGDKKNDSRVIKLLLIK